MLLTLVYPNATFLHSVVHILMRNLIHMNGKGDIICPSDNDAECY